MESNMEKKNTTDRQYSEPKRTLKTIEESTVNGRNPKGRHRLY